ncbi:MAG: hypothetical protein H0U76_17935 [Ktedonobacteraceae bacterium]|nr:hypothetical protein [Ktedonobacteraceae bacterium]
MNNAGTALIRVVVLAGGALAGALLAGWYDRMMSERAQEKFDYDKDRYAQGLSPLPQRPIIIEESQGESQGEGF